MIARGSAAAARARIAAMSVDATVTAPASPAGAAARRLSPRCRSRGGFGGVAFLCLLGLALAACDRGLPVRSAPLSSRTPAATVLASRADVGPELGAEEAALVGFLNEARADPRAFAERHLRERAGRSAAARECYVEMRRTEARPPLAPSRTLSAAARDHALDLGRSGQTGHTGSDGSTLAERVERHGRWDRSLGENLAFGIADPLEIVLGLLVDDGVPGRGHRRNILDPSFAHVGVALRPHPRFGVVAVVDFAGGIDR